MARHAPNRERTLVMFAKFPEAGAVKTRLALGEGKASNTGLQAIVQRSDVMPLGERAALEHCANLYEAFLRDRIAAHEVGDYRFRLGVSDPRDRERFQTLLGRELPHLSLQGRTMGDLLRYAFRQLLASGPVLITASDYPVLDEAIVAAAFDALDDVDVVLVPAADGAYNLIGMATFHDIFDLSAWSSGTELEETKRLLNACHISHRVLEECVIRDVDTLDDLVEIMHDLDPERAPHTARELAAWRERLALSA